MDLTKQTARLAGLFYLLLAVTSVIGLLGTPLVRRRCHGHSPHDCGFRASFSCRYCE